MNSKDLSSRGWVRRTVKFIAGWPPAWRAFRWFAEGNYQGTAAVIRRFADDGERWLDVGCGEAPMARLFRPDSYLGLDLDPQRLRRARELNPEHRFSLLDATEGLGHLGEISRFMLIHVLHHLCDLEAGRLLSALKQSAGPDARVLLVDPIPPADATKLLHRTLLPLETGPHHRRMDAAARMMNLEILNSGQDAGSFWYDSYWFWGKFKG